MNEEEIISLQELKYAVENIGTFDIGDFNYDGLKILLEYLEKESKQIEELQYLENSNWQQYANLKKKIKDKIQELEQNKEDYHFYLCSDDIRRTVKNILQELLNDENV